MREEHGEGAREEGTGEQHGTAALDVSPDTVLSRGVGIAFLDKSLSSSCNSS